MREYDLIVVGGGPSGLISAEYVASKGFKVAVLEEHSKVGVPEHCAGLISISGLKRLGERDFSYYTLNRIRGAIFKAYDGTYFSIKPRDYQALVVDRKKFDQNLASKALEKGTEMILKSRVLGLKRVRDGILCLTRNEKYYTRLLVDASGIYGLVRRYLGISERPLTLPAYQFLVRGRNKLECDEVMLEFDKRLSKCFFSWIIPLDEKTSRVGIATDLGDPMRVLRYVVKKNYEMSFRILRGYGGLVLISGPIKRTYADNLIVVGDSAGQTKPTTGGGVVTGGICAKIAGKVSLEALEEEDFSSSKLKLYEKVWKGMLGSEFRAMKLVRALLNVLSNDTMRKLFLKIKELDIEECLESYGDMDFQKKVIIEVLKDTRFLQSMFLPVLKDVLKNFNLKSLIYLL
ncbi:MAG: NAD(P)/FAD-dependent oxidoreductase [Candidatus Asgardarchaeia archaeon]